MATVNRRAPRPRAVTVDLWNTLIVQPVAARRRLEQERTTIWAGAARRAGAGPRRATALARAITARARRVEHTGIAPTIADQVDWLRRSLGRPVDGAAVARGVDAALATTDLRLVPGAVAGLDRLRDAGIRVGLVSNVLHESPVAVRRWLARTGLDAHLDPIVLSAEIGRAKPSPVPIRRALTALGVRPADAVHIGDERWDVVAAWRAGVAAIRFTGTARWWPPTHSTIRPPESRAPALRRWADLDRSFDRLVVAARDAVPRG